VRASSSSRRDARISRQRVGRVSPLRRVRGRGSGRRTSCETGGIRVADPARLARASASARSDHAARSEGACAMGARSNGCPRSAGFASVDGRPRRCKERRELARWEAGWPRTATGAAPAPRVAALVSSARSCRVLPREVPRMTAHSGADRRLRPLRFCLPGCRLSELGRGMDSPRGRID